MDWKRKMYRGKKCPEKGQLCSSVMVILVLVSVDVDEPQGTIVATKVRSMREGNVFSHLWGSVRRRGSPYPVLCWECIPWCDGTGPSQEGRNRKETPKERPTRRDWLGRTNQEGSLQEGPVRKDLWRGSPHQRRWRMHSMEGFLAVRMHFSFHLDFTPLGYRPTGWTSTWGSCLSKGV